MNSQLLDKIKHNLDELIVREELARKFTVVFGMNHPGDFIVEYLRENGVEASAVIDNNPANEGILFGGVRVTAPAESLSRFNDDAAILICSRYYSEMKVQLEGMGYTENVHIFKLLDMSGGGGATLCKDVFRQRAEAALEGAALAEKILTRFDALNALICPVKSQGDTYIACSILNANMDELEALKRVLVVVGGACAEIAKMFGVKNIYVAEQEEIDFLTCAYRMSPENGKIKILQPYWNYSSFINRLDCYKGLTFFDHYKSWVFGLDESAVMERPSVYANEEQAAPRLLELGLKKGETVIISPYANSLQGVAHTLFETVAKRLKGLGYCVATNVAGNEEAIAGTVPLSIPLSELIAAAEYAGAYVGIRNGLTELLSAASCRKAIIYPRKNYAFGSAMELYGVSGISGAGGDTLELTFDGDAAQYAERITQHIRQPILTGGGLN